MPEKSAKKFTTTVPAIAVCQNAGIDFHVHQSLYGNDNFGEEAASRLLEHLGVAPGRIFKTLVIKLSGKRTGLAIAVVPATGVLNLKTATAAVGAFKATMANPHDASFTTDYVPGGISPLDGRHKLPTAIGEAVTLTDTVFVSDDRRGWDIELSPVGLVSLCDATVADIAR